MRSIGKKNIKLVKQLVQGEIKERRRYEQVNFSEIRDVVLDKIPDKVFDIWESAHDEIERIIHDEIMRIKLEE